jgi:hypothetical protein
MTPPPVSLFDLLKLLPLFVGEIGCDLFVRFHHDLVNAPTGVVPYLLELRSRLVDNWRDFCDLFRCQVELRSKALFHSVAHSGRTVNLEKKMAGVPSSERGASDPTCNEYENESSNQFPP